VEKEKIHNMGMLFNWQHMPNYVYSHLKNQLYIEINVITTK